MADNPEPKIIKAIGDLVAERTAAIASGDRERIDATYVAHQLRRRNEFNGHDYDLYRQVIETGFGKEVNRFDIYLLDDVPVTISRQHLPFDGWPDYVVVLSTVTRRAMAWYVKLGLRNEPPRVMLPTFDGHFSDEIGTGTAWARQVLDHSIFQSAEKAETVLTFDEDAFGKELAKRIWLELCRVAPKVRLDKVRALAIDCIPYHSMLHLSLLNDREEFAADDEYAKWETDVWRFHDFPSTPQAHWPGAEDLILHVQHWQQSLTETLTNEEVAATDDQVCRACAKALLDPQVADALKHFKFQLTDDFEFGVWDPDNQAEGNYCDIIREERAGGEANAR